MTHRTTSRGLALAAVASVAIATVPFVASPASAAPGTLSLVGASLDGPAFDLDEYGASNITVQVTDSIAGAVDVDDAQDLEYSWTVTPFGGTPVRVPAAGNDVVPTDVVGTFTVPLPAGPSGTYVLTAGLTANGTGGGAVAAKEVLTVKAGEATLAFTGADPLLAQAGADTPVAGTLKLEDGTGLPGRVVQLELTRGTSGSDPVADAGFVLTDPTAAPDLTRQVFTGTDGSFSAVLRDPAETPQGTEIGGSIRVDTASTPNIGSADATATTDVDVVSSEPPAGSTVVVTDLGSSKPGRSLPGTATVSAPDDTFATDPGTAVDPVEGQLVTLTLDHGFFTTGDEEPGAVVGAPAGNLVDLGTTLTAVTDANGEVPFQVAVERDTGFDGDGALTAQVTATAGTVTGREDADWTTANPLNGRVTIDLSPAGEQDAPVDPAVSGDRTYYEVTARDQFGNPVDGRPVDLAYSGDLDDYDYSGDDAVTSDLDTDGDIWVVSFEPAAIDVTGTWASAPTTLYTDTAGSSAPGTADATGTATARFYDLDFDASRFTMTSTATTRRTVGTAVTQTVKVVDQLGRPVRGYLVRFFRFGPDVTNGEPRASVVTNARGEATYTFVGTSPGRARITAEVGDGLRIRTLTGAVSFGLPIRASLTGRSNGRNPDRLTVRAPRVAAGARVVLYRVVGRTARVVRTGKVGPAGTAVFSVKDRNGKRFSSYRAVVRANDTVFEATTGTKKVR